MSNAYIPDQLHHMSKKELLEFAQTAHEENVKLVQQLAKANERIENLEHCCESQEKNLMRQCVFMEKTAEKLEQHREWQATANVLRRPTREAKQALNKFAIEKKIDLLSKMVSSASDYMFNHDKLDIRANHLDMLLKNFCNYHREQLRKEQE